MSHLPNEDAAECLVREIGPHLWQECPDARIQLVGADPGDKVRSLASDRVEVTGRVPDIRPYLWDATVVAVPMRIGTGIKNKLLEAWAAGAPVVTTSMACQGVSAKAGENILVGDGAQSFCREVLSVVRQERLEDELRCASRRAACAMSWQMMTEGLVSLVTGRKKASPSWEAC
jgi:glycosyltransferase involved in cell wall biosynthesis